MRTDRELLELAAKAAGYEWQWFGANFNVRRPDGLWEQWNPLTDDGDALRLAAKLGIGVIYYFSGSVGEPEFFCIRAQRFDIEAEEASGTPCAATRRAVSRVAAEIGEGMQ